MGTGFYGARDKEGIVCYEVLGRVRLFLSRIFQISYCFSFLMIFRSFKEFR